MAHRCRLDLCPGNTRTWTRHASHHQVTLPITWKIAHAAAALSGHEGFPKDPADRLIYSTAAEHGIELVTKDDGLRDFDPEVCRW